MCSTNPSHTLTCVCHLHINSSTSHFPHVFLFFSLLLLWCVCLPLPLFMKYNDTSHFLLLFMKCLLAAHLLFHFSLPSCSPLLLSFATMVCVPPSPSLYRVMATLLSFGPRAAVTPQLWSCCWERGLTRRPRIR